MGVIDRYREKRPIYESLSQRLRHLLHDIVKENGIELHAIEARAKTLDSFAEKTNRPGKAYTNPLEEIVDLCGLRVILYYQEDVDRLSDILREEFNVDHLRSVDKRDELRSDQFGYISVHLVCQLQENRAALPEWRAYRGLHAEIQVRTVLQHAWASISHALQYKREFEVPEQFSRQLMRIAGLLELSDEQFSALRKKTDVLRKDIDRRLAKSDLRMVINSVSLDQFVSSSDFVLQIVNTARNVGFSIVGDSGAAQIVAMCQRFGISELSELSLLLEKFLLNALKFFKAFADVQKEHGMEIENITGGKDHWSAVAVVAMKYKSEEEGKFIVKDNVWSDLYLDEVRLAAMRALATP
ncbi:MAG TPA: hypothetical protein DEO64_08835 [Alcaligenes faecalis]|nr:hypothetical protein [Alcaligenes faecalis]